MPALPKGFCALALVLLAVVLFAPAGMGRLDAAEGRNTERAAVEAVNGLAVDLYKELRREEGNLCFSPYSISSAFSMVYAGAKDETAHEMEQSLGFGQGIGESYRGLTKGMLAAPEDAGDLEVANSIWPQRGYRLLRTYVKELEENYASEVRTQDFAKQPERARRDINAWVRERTRERIGEILPEGAIGADTRMILVNAVYFRAPWMHVFPQSATREEVFFATPSTEVAAPMMRVSDAFAYHETPEVQAVRIPYRMGAFSMTVILPKARNGLSAVEMSLDRAFLHTLSGELERRKVDLSIPRFRIETDLLLNESMKRLGVQRAFDPGFADFSGMNGKHDLYLSDALHRAVVAVDEEGTEASAATALTMKRTSAPLPLMEPVVFRADHPFLFLIQEDISGAILFIGRVCRP